MPKDIKHLVKDIENIVIKGKANAASNIQFSLQYRSPYWTGTFNAAWKVQKGRPVDPVKPRKENQGYRSGVRAPERGPIIKTSLSEALYVGNETEYAGFVINRMRSLETAGLTSDQIFGNNSEGNPRGVAPIEFYEDLFAINADTSPIPNSPEWYYYYIATEELTKDIDQGFTAQGLRYVPD
tara:strand:+ start:122 stop:667 length:546 start_codon:yes stop_codon:yes gene_type:complete